MGIGVRPRNGLSDQRRSVLVSESTCIYFLSERY